MRTVPILGAALSLLATASFASATLVLNSFPAAATNNALTDSGTASSTTGAPNTFMGSAFTLADPGAFEITGLDFTVSNNSGATLTGLMRTTVYFWNGVNTGTVNAENPAFFDLAGVRTINLGERTINTSSFIRFQTAEPGVTPSVAFTTPVPISDATIGITLSHAISLDGGNTFQTQQGLTSIIRRGTDPIQVGVDVFPTGWYRNINGDTNGNFTNGRSAFSGGDNQALAVRVYANIPEPTGVAAVGLAGCGLLLRRRSSSRA